MISTTHYEHILKKDVWHELEIKSALKTDSSIYDLLRAAIAAKTLTPICTVQISEDGASVYGFDKMDIVKWAIAKGYSMPAGLPVTCEQQAKSKSKNQLRDDDFNKWVSEAQPSLSDMTKLQIHRTLIARNNRLWRSGFDDWWKVQVIYKGQPGRKPG